MKGLSSRTPIAQLPTPLEPADRLSAAWGGPRIWVKRDDLTGFGVSGNKVRKLEYHAAAASAEGADLIITCGAVQSNHCRATALVAARLGLACHLFLRSPDGKAPAAISGNHLLARLAGAEVTIVDPDWYANRDEHMAAFSAELRVAGRVPWVIPEGASDAIGMQGFVQAGREVDVQLEAAGIGGAVHWHTASSGGTTAGLASHFAGRQPVIAVSVSDPAAALKERVATILRDAGVEDVSDTVEYRDEFIGRGYGLATAGELASQLEATRLTGLIFDPTYTGKAMHALKMEIDTGRFSPRDDVVFWHTGGGFAALGFDYGAALG